MSEKITEQFSNDIARFLEELYQLNSYYQLNKYLKEKSGDEENLRAMNVAPAFFQLTIKSFQYSAMMGLARLYEPPTRNSKSIFKFLNFIENNHKQIFSNDPQVKKKLGRSSDVDYSTVIKHREQLSEVGTVINNLLTWRDKAFAHNDKKYFSARESLGIEFPLTYKEIETLIELAADIFNTYQIAYNGIKTVIEPTNTYDVNNVLEVLKFYSGHVTPR